MKKIYRLLLVIIATTFFSPTLVPARTLNEDAAINLLLQTLERDHVYAKRISLNCVTFDTEDTTRTYFEIALREKHDAKCGGDPDTNPVIDRYRVNRASGRIELYDLPDDRWQDYKPARIK
ncbi:MAG TPA: hypothetical protein VLK27_04965 [Chthoniobacterales bacterium]|nr:hypothetical protein [Chthoniobacterales bacterium]